MKLLLLLLLQFPLLAASLVIDCGSPTDQYFTGGLSDFTISYPGATGDLTLRYGTFSYRIPAPPGPSIVTLVFRETGTVTAANQRRFYVAFNEQPAVLVNYDLYAVAGLSTIRREFQVFSIDGFIHIFFTYSRKSAIVSSIEVAPVQVPTPGTPFRVISATPERQPDGTYLIGTPMQTGSMVYDVSIYRNGLRLRPWRFSGPSSDYETVPQGGFLRVDPVLPWSESDVILVDYTIYYPPPAQIPVSVVP